MEPGYVYVDYLNIGRANEIFSVFFHRVHKIVKQDNACTICLELLNNPDSSIVSGGDNALGLLKCGHIFHFECIWRWIRAHINCPVCRTQTNMTVDDIKAITIAAFEKAVRSKTLSSQHRNKKGKKRESKGFKLKGIYCYFDVRRRVG